MKNYTELILISRGLVIRFSQYFYLINTFDPEFDQPQPGYNFIRVSTEFGFRREKW